ncbi:MAG: PQQ-dependent sugar dehydrogenase [Gemmatimonadaceae bacterium]
MITRTILLTACSLVLAAPSFAQGSGRLHCAADNAGLTLPPGFCAQVVSDSVPGARHVASLPNGDLLVATATRAGGGVVVLRDTNGDGIADVRRTFGVGSGSGIAWRAGKLYFAADSFIVRWQFPAGALEPTGKADTIVSKLLSRGQHAAKTIALSADGANLFANIGAPSNSCQKDDRKTESPGQDPCPILENGGGIWRFDANRTGQVQGDGERWVTGIRNIVAITMGPDGRTPYGAQHGRDMLSGNWGKLFDDKKSAENPGEEFFRLQRGADFGWPFCYWDVDLAKKVLAPEYGGDGRTQGKCANVGQPLVAFPGHWAPDGAVFYGGTQFPASYRGGAFIAFHGSWNRAPLPQAGFNVSFVPFTNGAPSGGHTVFADGFRGKPDEQLHRPTGLAVAADGSLIVTDDKAGRIYRISWTGKLVTSELPASKRTRPQEARGRAPFVKGPARREC